MKSRKPTLGSLLRGLRMRNGWTLREMSERTGMPISTLSKVEHNRLTLTYEKLVQLSERLNIRMSELFAEAPAEGNEAPTVTARRSISDIDRALLVRTPNYDHFFVCTELRRKRMIPLFTRIRVKSIDEFGDFVRHPGEEFLYVVKGDIVVHTEFYDPTVLKEGECIYLDSTMGHAYTVAEGCDEALVLGVCCGEGDLLGSLMSSEDEESAA
ncbi:MAG TPA: XRE family transcriptional regulator [Woeseiaceae bacterium]|nr:XRE family transcriptional regulator [Woeseiaceae bacterium]